MANRQASEKEKTAAHGAAAGLTEGLLRRLNAEAHRSPGSEAYQELAGGPGFRLAIAVTPHGGRAPRYSFLVLIDSPKRARAHGRIPDGPFAEIEAALAARGYLATRLDNGWMAHERFLARSRLVAEWAFLQRLLKRPGPTTGGNP